MNYYTASTLKDAMASGKCLLPMAQSHTLAEHGEDDDDDDDDVEIQNVRIIVNSNMCQPTRDTRLFLFNTHFI